MTVVYVSALYRDCGDDEEQFQSLVTACPNQPFVLFTDREDLKSKQSNLTIQVVPKSELFAFQQTEAKLPQLRNQERDTLSYLQFGNAKPEFLYRASLLAPADGYCWLNADIVKLFRSPDHLASRLVYTQEALTVAPNQIISPGCLHPEAIKWDTLFAFPIWRFCGGLLLVPKTRVEQFHTLVKEHLQNCFRLGALTWEVNIWATLEKDTPGLFFWYSADHNESIADFPKRHKQKRVIFLSMIKNEHKIIKRCIQSALGIADAVCICDTGSTDNTLEVLQDYFKELTVPAKVYHGETYAWRNFSHNRTLSFQCAVDYCKILGWDPEHTYAVLLDADMQLRPQPKFDKQELKAIGYKIIQQSGSLEYYNTRFVKLGFPWKCTGVTHEYWDGASTDTLTKDIIFIDDVGDGGCKADKFERDVRLLEEGLREDPKNARYMFYLAQSYKDNNQHDKAIEWYKKRIEAGGWYEEIWYSMYTLMKLYAHKNQSAEVEYWGMKAYEYRKERAENILFLVRWFKDRRQYWKAWHYWELGSQISKPNDLLFLETDCYEKGFTYERAIIHDYVFPHKKKESLEISLAYFNKYGEYFSYNNIQWFVQPLGGTVRPLLFQDIGDYVATSTSVAPLSDGTTRLNVRYVNYRIQPNGSYLMSENGILSGDHAVRTENYTCLMDKDLNLISSLEKMVMPDPPSQQNARIQGLEDVRLYRTESGDQLGYVATTMNYSYNGKIRIHGGLYNPVTHQFEKSASLRPPTETDCEKNWIPYKGNKFIYKWHPFQIGSLNADNQLVLESTQQVPRFLEHMRGSSNLIEEGGFWYGITHCVIYQQPRKYYHMVVKIDGATNRLVGYTDPFFFVKNAIEYSLGFLKRGDTYVAIVSQNDRHPIMVTFEDKDIRWHSI